MSDLTNEEAKAEFYATINEFVPPTRLMEAMRAEIIDVRMRLSTRTHERDKTQAWVAKLEDENRALSRKYESACVSLSERNVLIADLADKLKATRAELATAKAQLAAVPVAALRRILFTGYRTDEQIAADADKVNRWFVAQDERLVEVANEYLDRPEVAAKLSEGFEAMEAWIDEHLGEDV